MKKVLLVCAVLLLPSLSFAQAAPYPITVCCNGSGWSEGLPSSNSATGVAISTFITLGGGSSITMSSGKWTLDGSGLVGNAAFNITLNTNKFTVVGTNGNTVVGGTLAVTGASTFTTASFWANGFAGINVGSSVYTGRGTTNPTNALNIYDGTAPAGAAGSGFETLYSTAGELRVMDAGGVATLLSPHDHATGKWIFDSIESSTGRRITIQMEDLAKWIDAHYGTSFVVETAPPSPYPVVKR